MLAASQDETIAEPSFLDFNSPRSKPLFGGFQDSIAEDPIDVLDQENNDFMEDDEPRVRTTTSHDLKISFVESQNAPAEWLKQMLQILLNNNNSMKEKNEALEAVAPIGMFHLNDRDRIPY
jgi:hypothetical protein